MAHDLEALLRPLRTESEKLRPQGARLWRWLALVFLMSSSFILGACLAFRPRGAHGGSILGVHAPWQPALWKARTLPIFGSEPLAKNLVRRFDEYLMYGASFNEGEAKLRNVGQWLAQEFVYESVGFPSTRTLRDWCISGEESQYRAAFPMTSFSQMLFLGEGQHATTTSYGKAHWDKDLFGIPPPNKWVTLRVTDFYHAHRTGPHEGLLDYNFMLIDFADLFRQVGRPVLPPAPLPEGLVMTANADDGVPAPLSVLVVDRDAAAAERAAAGALFESWAAGEPAQKWWHSDLIFWGPGGIGRASSVNEFQRHVLDPYHAAFADRRFEKHMLFCEGNYCGAFGVLWGRHVGTWVGQPASNKTVGIRLGMHFRVVEGKVQEGWAIFDFPGLLHQLGADFFALARGRQGPLLH